MNKDKLVKLEAYKQKLEDRLSSPTPDKHKDHPASFKAFLKNELRLVSNMLERIRLGDV